MAGLASLARALTQQISERKSEVALFEYDSKDALALGRDGQPEGFRFQYFPATVTFSKAVNYSQKAIPGGNLPLYQWIHGGEGILNFTAEFSCDVDLAAYGPVQGAATMEGLKRLGASSRNVDIRSALTWLGNLMLASYEGGARDSAATLTRPPPKLLLIMPNSGIGLAAGDNGSSSAVAPDSLVCILENKEVTYEAFFPSGLPRLVQAQLTFKQVGQVAGGVTFPGRTQRMRNAITGAPFLGYPLYSRIRV